MATAKEHVLAVVALGFILDVKGIATRLVVALVPDDVAGCDFTDEQAVSSSVCADHFATETKLAITAALTVLGALP